MTKSRLGQVPSEQPRGAARFAAPLAPAVYVTPKHKDINTSHNKERTTLYLPLSVTERLAELRRALRRRGIKARDASNSALVSLLVSRLSVETVIALYDERNAPLPDVDPDDAAS
jgi:hypothetical protein